MSKITTIEELKKRIGKYVIFSSYDEDCRPDSSTMKLVTKIEERPQWIVTANPLSQIYGYPIWGKQSAHMSPFMPYEPYDASGESYSNAYTYARDPSEEELKQFRQNWRKKIFKGVCSTNSINQLPL